MVEKVISCELCPKDMNCPDLVRIQIRLAPSMLDYFSKTIKTIPFSSYVTMRIRISLLVPNASTFTYHLELRNVRMKIGKLTCFTNCCINRETILELHCHRLAKNCIENFEYNIARNEIERRN